MRGRLSKLAGGITTRYGHTAAWGIELLRSSRRKSAGKRAVEKTLRGKVQTTFPLRLEIPQTPRDSHFPTAPATTVPAPPSRFRTKPRVLTYDWTKNRGQVMAFFHFYGIAASQMERNSEVLGRALKNAFSCERDFMKSERRQPIWDFDSQPWAALKLLYITGRTDDFLDCVEIVFDYRQQITTF